MTSIFTLKEVTNSITAVFIDIWYRESLRMLFIYKNALTEISLDTETINKRYQSNLLGTK